MNIMDYRNLFCIYMPMMCYFSLHGNKLQKLGFVTWWQHEVINV